MKNLKKILVTTPFFYPHIGGSEQYMEDLYINLLRKHSNLQVDVLCYNTDLVSTEEKYRNLNIYRLPCLNILPNKFAIPNPIALINFFYTHKNYDLYHASTRFFDLSWWVLIFGKLTNKKVILTDHCADTPTHPNPLIRFLTSFIDTISGKLSLKFYDKIFVVSNATKIFLKQKFNIQSKVLYAGINNEFSIPRHPISRKYAKVRVIYAGRMIAVKGVLELFEVVSKMNQIDVLFVGPGELVKVLQKKALQQKLSNIQILGQVNKKRLSDLFRKSDIFIYPSYHSEGIPMALLEAGASNLAVIATNTGGIKEVIQANKTGLLIKPKDNEALKLALEELINDKALRQKLSRNLFTFIQKTFNWDKTCKLFYSEIKSLL